MKISKVDDATIVFAQQYQKIEKMNSESGSKVKFSVTSEEKVNLSTTARDIQQLQEAIRQLPEIREDKVQELKNRIDAGKYNVNGAKVAESMVRESLLDIIV